MSVVWLPLEGACICADCSALFTFCRGGCPACGSQQFVPISGLLNTPEPCAQAHQAMRTTIKALGLEEEEC